MNHLEWLEGLGFLGLFIATLSSSTFFPTLGTPLILVLIAQDTELINIIIVATIGNWLGSLINYYLGYYARWDWLEKFCKIKPENLQKIQFKLKPYQSISGLLTGFPIVGDRIAMIMGLLKMKKSSSFIFIFFGKLIRYIILVKLLSMGATAFL